MTNEDFVAALSQQLNLETKKTSEILATAITIISEKLAEGARISVENFGILATEKKPEHIFVEQESRQRFLMPPEIEVVFKPNSAFIEKFKEKTA
ncbi:MAG: HU family DNA-binding protein [Dysgonamonadaceae bacterium]|jgi:nucleoid DNA-binding protein|nr:HU family DNA-binding protein [Dysgonamonadaceae bacterium]MDD3494955.1 HU family DNA-binding protein [Dysgonamonadaceae bacterium]MDD4378461.1 HU family DNA-binding protein [Dysgonamonadaceae bacterium]